MNTMKSKHLLILLLSLFVFCFSSTVFANKAQDEAIDYLKQAVENTANAKNLTYKINLSMTSPLADGDIIVDGKYYELMNTSGNMNISFNSWIDTIKFEATTQFYTEIADNNLNQYLKMKTTPLINDINPDQWYISSTTLADNANELFSKKKQFNLDKFTQNITNIFMYDVNKNTAKIYVTYTRPILDEGMKAELKTLYAKDDKQKQNLEKLDNLLAKNPQLVESLAKPRKISYELTIDKKSQSITNLKTDFSNNIQEFGNEVLDSIPDEEFSDVNGYVLRNTFKNYLNLSKFNLNIRISHLNNTTVDEIPQELKTSALPLPETDLPQPTQTTLLSKL